MTQIHPDAGALVKKHAATDLSTVMTKLEAGQAISEALYERDALKSAADDVYNRLMPEVTALREKLAQAVEVMRPFAKFSEVKPPINRLNGDVAFISETIYGMADLKYTDTDAAAKFVKENDK